MEEVRVEKAGREVVVKVRYEGRVERKVEKEKERGVVTHMIFMPVIDRINDMREDGKEVMRLKDTVMCRSMKGKGTLEIEVELGEGGEHLDEDALKKIFEVMIGEFVCEKNDRSKGISCLPV